jgi:hypothetical protein
MDLDQFAREAQERSCLRLEREYWVFSLAGNRTHAMLWSHYAEGHSGPCLHFHADETSVFGVAQQVRYEDERPFLEIPLPSEEEVADRSLLWKQKFWVYEEEFRLVRYPGNVYEPFLHVRIGV